MGNVHDHRKCAQECVAMAQRSGDNNDKALWLTLAQSWVRLAEHIASVEGESDDPHYGGNVLELRLPERG